MDNLTHSLAGAVLGQMGLKTKTGLGMATLIIAANIPDIDAVATLLDGVQHLAIRRGITHGPIAMLVLPLLLTAIMIGFDRWQTRRGKRPADRLPIHKGWLLALAYIGCLSHPALDWLNSYGIRLLEPFSSQWFYGDSIFIIDIWIWAALIAGVWVSRRQEKKEAGNWRRPAWISFAAVCAYIFANGLITGKAEADTHRFVEQEYGIEPTLVVANPIPIIFWRREMLWQNDTLFGARNYDIISDRHNRRFTIGDQMFFGGLRGNREMKDPAVSRAIDTNQQLKYFLFWSRMPQARVRKDGLKTHVYVGDARFLSDLASPRFSVETTFGGG